LKQNKINKELPYYLYIHNIYLYQYHDTKPNPITIDWLLGLTPTQDTHTCLKPELSESTMGILRRVEMVV